MLYQITEVAPNSSIVYGVEAALANHPNVSGFIVPLSVPRGYILEVGHTYSFIPSNSYPKGRLDVSAKSPSQLYR